MNDRPPKYETGAHFWRDVVNQHGLEEAVGICGRYLSAQLRTDSSEERQFCRELFTAMVEDTISRTDPTKLMYPYPFQKANERMEASYYHESRKRNTECARAIDNAIHASCYKPNYYNLEIAAMLAIHEHGFNRVNAVLANALQRNEWDGRYSKSNKEWAKGFSLTDRAFDSALLSAHPVLVEDFTFHARKLYDAVGAERFLLPGCPETGEAVQGYEIVRSIAFNDQRGFAIGLNPDAVSQFVTWQFTMEDGKRDFYWGHYTDDLAGAADNYIARTIVHMDSGAKEVLNPFAAAEMSAEQNYNMIDGTVNNEKSRLDLTDGQTHEETRELAPESLPDKKPSVLDQIREARMNPQPHTPAEAPDKGASEPEL